MGGLKALTAKSKILKVHRKETCIFLAQNSNSPLIVYAYPPTFLLRGAEGIEYHQCLIFSIHAVTMRSVALSQLSYVPSARYMFNPS